MEPVPGIARPSISRRHFLAAAGLVGIGGVVGALADRIGWSAILPGPGARPSPAASPSPAPSAVSRRRYRSRPDVAPPMVEVTTHEAALAPGLIFLTPGNGAAPDGPMIVDDAGELVWMHAASAANATDLRVASYRGQPVLTWWEGANNAGIGTGEHVMADAGYREIARIRAADGRTADLHELRLTPRGTALFFADTGADPPPSPTATKLGRQVMDCAVQEVDVATGKLLFEWHASDHIGLDESVAAAPTGAPDQVYDYVHANSIDEDGDGNLILSARNTSAIYKIDRTSGGILWRLGGRRSDFAMGPGTTFALQHDARRQPDGTLTVFDDGQAPGHSRAIVLRLDETAMTATLVREYVHPQGLLATSQGNMQLLPDGHAFVGWGSLAQFSEFSSDGRLLLDATFTVAQSYRDYRFAWAGRPAQGPAIAVDRGDDTVTVYASWNGATGVAAWEVLAGPAAGNLRSAGVAARIGFETAVEVDGSAAWFAVQARDPDGAVLGTSSAISG